MQNVTRLTTINDLKIPKCEPVASHAQVACHGRDPVIQDAKMAVAEEVRIRSMSRFNFVVPLKVANVVKEKCLTYVSLVVCNKFDNSSTGNTPRYASRIPGISGKVVRWSN
jgi:hypothetical protein